MHPVRSVSGARVAAGFCVGAKQKETELPSGIVAMGARVYDPYTGTFAQPDPIQGGGANAYGYTDGDPVNETDLTGDCFPCISVDDVVHVVTWPVREGAAVGEDVAGAAVDVGARAAGGVFGAIVEPLLFPTNLNAASCETHDDCESPTLTPDQIRKGPAGPKITGTAQRGSPYPDPDGGPEFEPGASKGLKAAVIIAKILGVLTHGH
jgi:RHS repeat-associated protein